MSRPIISLMLLRNRSVSSPTDIQYADRSFLEEGPHEMKVVENPINPGKGPKWLVTIEENRGMSIDSWCRLINGVLSDIKGHENFGKPIDWGIDGVEITIDGVVHPPNTPFPTFT